MFNLKAKWAFVFVVVLTLVFLLGALKLSGLAEGNLLVGKAFSEQMLPTEEKKEGIVFVGDIMLARSVERSLLSLPQNHAFLGAKELFKDNFVMGNFEASVPLQHVPTPNFTFKFSVTPQLLPILAEAGIKHLSLANNHALDYGNDGYKNTLKELEENDLIPFGHPSLVSGSSVSYINLQGKKVAIIAMSNLFTLPASAEWGSVLKEATSKSDLQIVYIHWGEEYELVHSSSDEAFAKELIDAGVDVIVGHHPHVVQDIWRYGDGIIFYSLGNFIFDQYWEDAVLNGLALELSYIDEEDWEIRLVPVESKSVRLQPREMVGQERQTFLNLLSERSDPALMENIKKGVISLQF